MLEVGGNLWDEYDKGGWVVITTNGTVKDNGCAVMGRGVAAQAAQRFRGLPAELGAKLNIYGNRVLIFDKLRLATFPVKHQWWEKADLRLIVASVWQLKSYVDLDYLPGGVYMPRPGCGNGGRNWSEVKPLLFPLDDRFIVMEL